MLSGQKIVCISSIDWDFIWQGHQQIMSTLAANGNQILYIENTGVRRPGLRDVSRLRGRILNWWRSRKGIREERDNLFVYSPLVLPLPYSRVARWINRFIIVRAVKRWMSAFGIENPIVWTFLPTPLAMDVMKSLEPRAVVYYCIDDFEASSAGAKSIRRTEDKLLAEADLVFVTSNRLRERALQFRTTVGLFPFAVDYPRFEAARLSPESPPPELLSLPRPIVGYVGGLHRFVDQELIADTARRLPDASFVMIGPEQCDVSTLAAEPNILLLGKKAHSELPGYIKGFDIGTVPYIFDDYTANVYPTKLNEYLAMGIPVVATGLLEIERFIEKHGDVVATANTSEEMVAAVGAASMGSSAAEVERRVEVARGNGWDARIRDMSGLIDEVLTARAVQPKSWEEGLRSLYRSARRRTVKGLGVAVVLYLILFHTPFLWAVARPLRISEPPVPADAIVVFAGGVGESGTAGGGYQERVLQSVELYRAGYAPTMVISSGFVFAFQEAEVMKDLAVGLGIPPEAIVLEKLAANTLDNVVRTRDILQTMGADRILLVSSPYHMRRAILTWEKQAPAIDVVATPVPVSQYYQTSEPIRLEQVRGIVWEYAALLMYRVRGWL